jgi:biopolymer transport protein ExbB/TolQ
MNSLIDGLTPLLSLLETGILVLLLLLGAATVGIFAWRLRVVARARGNPEKWTRWLSRDWKEDAAPESDAKEDNAPARLMRTGLANLEMSPDALEKVLDAQGLAERRELEKGASFLATVGSNAPFLGLTGTVLGILTAFHRFAEAGGKGGTEVMSAISRALVATAVGLLVAIPAVIFYNLLRTRIRAIQDRGRELSALLLARSLHAAARKEI